MVNLFTRPDNALSHGCHEDDQNFYVTDVTVFLDEELQKYVHSSQINSKLKVAFDS